MTKFDVSIIVSCIIIIATMLFYSRQRSLSLTKDMTKLDLENQALRMEIATAKLEMDKTRESCEKLEKQLKERGKSQELIEFLKDIEVKGYGVVRINPDDYFYRGRR